MVAKKIFAASSEVVGGRVHEEAGAVQSEMSQLEDPVVQAENPLWMDRSKAQSFVVLWRHVKRVPQALK